MQLSALSPGSIGNRILSSALAPSPPANEIPGVFVSGFSCLQTIEWSEHPLPPTQVAGKSHRVVPRISDKSWDWLIPLLAQQQLADDCELCPH